MIIYKAINNINGKCYIGQTIHTLDKRKYNHKCQVKNKSNFYFHNALRKYGWNNFEWKIIEKCESKDELDEMEFHYIKQYNSYMSDNGYNMNWGGKKPITYKKVERPKYACSKKTREKISKSVKKLWKNSEYQKKQRSIWNIINPKGEKILVENLKEWCKKQTNMVYNSCTQSYRRNTTYRGYSFEKIG